MRHQHRQHLERLLPERNLHALPSQFTRAQFEFEDAEADGTRGAGRWVRVSPQRSGHAPDEQMDCWGKARADCSTRMHDWKKR